MDHDQQATATPADLPLLTIPPASTTTTTTNSQSHSPTHTHTVIFLHGRGDNTRSFTRALHNWTDSRGRTLFESFPTFRFVFPQAPMRPLASTAHHFRSHIVPQWFDVWDARDFGLREEVQLEGLREMVPLVRRLIAREAEKLGGRWDRVVLAGISMGCATSVHTLFNLVVPEEGGGRLAAFMGFSGRCPFAGRSLQGMREMLGLGDGVPEGGENGVLRRMPMLLEHCVDDPLVKIERGRGLRDTLREFGANVEWREYPAGGHWFRELEGIDDVLEFLNRVVLGKEGAANPASGEQAVGRVDTDAMDLS